MLNEVDYAKLSFLPFLQDLEDQKLLRAHTEINSHYYVTIKS
jgi:hypothetical protein